MLRLIHDLAARDFMPHGHCFFWRPEILWTHVIADVLIACAYFFIPATLVYFALKRRDWPFPRILYLFGAFILACGTTHLMGVWTIWAPLYPLEGLIKAITAAISVATAVTLVPLVPRALAFRSPEDLEDGNRELERQIRERLETESELRRQKSLVELLKAVAIAANEAPDVQTAIRTCLEKVCAFTGWPVGHAAVPSEPPGDDTVCHVWRCDDPERFHLLRQITEAMRLAPGAGFSGRVLESGKPAWISNIEGSADFLRARWKADLGVRSGFAFPILIGTEPVGILEFFSPEPSEPNEGLLEISRNVGAQIGHVIERSRARKELAAARDAALEASQLKSAFLANMSHEIRTPLNIILGYNAIIADRFAPDSPERTLLEGIDRASNRLMQTIHGILDLSKIETRTFRIDPVPMDLPAVARKHVEDFQVLARDKGLHLVCEIDEHDASIRFDEYCLSQSLMNLLQNAIKFTDDGQVAVRVYRDERWNLCLEVRDTGVGIDPAYLPRVFSPFSQEEAGYSRRFEGSGLGLALTRNYLELNDAEISVRSEKGKGSVFTIRFSKGSELWGADEMTEHRESPHTPRIGENPSACRPWVLVVDDDPDTLLYMRTLLSSRYEVLVASSGAEVRQQLADHGDRLRVILMDLSLRGPEDGLMITQELRQRPEWKSIPILALTAHAFSEDRGRAFAAGCDGYFSKPFGHHELLEAMQALLDEGPKLATGS